MEKEIGIEYCKYCDDIYATNPIVWVMFDSCQGETHRSSEDVVPCPRCGYPMRRFEGYLESLRRRETEGFIEDVIKDIHELSNESLVILKEILMKFSVPSFAVQMDLEMKVCLHELVKKRYVEYQHTDDRLIVYINAKKLRLIDNDDLLLRMVYQRSFITSPEHLVKTDIGGIRRKARMNALVNDFTDDDRTNLLEKFGGKCALTGKDVPIQLDHVIPIAIGHGGTTKGNMLPIWQRINSSKNDRNIFEWYERNAERFEVCPERFRRAIEYIADLNDMTYDEYREYVYDCHANPNDMLTEVD